MPRAHQLGMLAATLVVAAGVPVLCAAPAQASAYRYWSYWHGDAGSWQLSGVGPATWPVHDGSVEGWRFAVSANTRSSPAPRKSPSAAFAALCGATAKVAGTVRVALVLDFGTASDAVPGDPVPATPLAGECVGVPEGSRGVDVLNEAQVSIRSDGSGLICALAGYPKVGCGEVVADPTPTRTGTTTPPRSPKPTRSGTSGTAPDRSPDPTRPATHRARTPTPTTGTTTTTTTTASAPGSPTAATTPAPTSAAATTPPATADGDTSPSLVAGLPVASTSDSGSPGPAIAVVAGVLAVGGGAYWRRRRAR